jgi:hypothetical protein
MVSRVDVLAATIEAVKRNPQMDGGSVSGSGRNCCRSFYALTRPVTSYKNLRRVSEARLRRTFT